MNHTSIKTLGELKKSGYQPKSVKQELRDNLIAKLRNKEKVFRGIYGYDDTVLPELQRAILSMHNINLLGLRGQAKTRIARLMVDLLDEYIPVLVGSELNEDPLHPITRQSQALIEAEGDATPIAWLHRGERYTEKLATPDVSVADLIGDVDPIKAATLKLSYADDRVIHFGLIPRSHRGIFVINELPDLQARIQVSLFNILQEGDIQIRGFKLRLPLDIQFVFTANPEDYTNRGSIITPLKDRIDSQIITHYPSSIEIGKAITKQEAHVKAGQDKVFVPELLNDLIEQIAIEGRSSEYVDSKSGVSARLTISALETLISAAERRMIINNEEGASVRITDLWSVIPSITGKVELVYEGEQEGAMIVAQNLIGKALRNRFLEYFPDPESFKKEKRESAYQTITDWFAEGKYVDIYNDMPSAEFNAVLYSVPGLYELVSEKIQDLDKATILLYMEFVLYALAEFSQISRNNVTTKVTFKDLMNSMLGGIDFEDLDDDQ